jgi:hypothetical protein
MAPDWLPLQPLTALDWLPRRLLTALDWLPRAKAQTPRRLAAVVLLPVHVQAPQYTPPAQAAAPPTLRTPVDCARASRSITPLEKRRSSHATVSPSCA